MWWNNYDQYSEHAIKAFVCNTLDKFNMSTFSIEKYFYTCGSYYQTYFARSTGVHCIGTLWNDCNRTKYNIFMVLRVPYFLCSTGIHCMYRDSFKCNSCFNRGLEKLFGSGLIKWNVETKAQRINKTTIETRRHTNVSSIRRESLHAETWNIVQIKLFHFFLAFDFILCNHM